MIHNGNNADYRIILLQFNTIDSVCFGQEDTRCEDNWII